MSWICSVVYESPPCGPSLLWVLSVSFFILFSHSTEDLVTDVGSHAPLRSRFAYFFIFESVVIVILSIFQAFESEAAIGTTPVFSPNMPPIEGVSVACICRG
jgi:hypothetical protein